MIEMGLSEQKLTMEGVSVEMEMPWSKLTGERMMVRSTKKLTERVQVFIASALVTAVDTVAEAYYKLFNL
jgi:hypothetical protein